MLNKQTTLLFAFMILLTAASRSAAYPPSELGPWKAAGKLRLPSPAADVNFSDDKRLVLALCSEKRRRDSGGTVPGFVQIFTLRCFAVDSGKEVLTAEIGQLAPRMAQRGNRLAVSDTFDKVTVYDLDAGKKIAQIDPRSPNDSPLGANKGIPAELRDFGGGGRLSDIEFTPDAKVLVTIRKENTPWKDNGRGAFTSESFDRVVFWNFNNGSKLATLDCEDRQLYDGHLTLLPNRKQMLTKFSNGLRLLDLTTMKWGKSYSMKDVWNAAVSIDGKKIAVTGRDQSVRMLDAGSLKLLGTFREQPVNMLPRDDGSLNPTGFEFGPSAYFVDGDRALRVVLNDQQTVLYRDAGTGAKIQVPASENPPGGAVKIVAVSQDRRCVVTMPLQGGEECTVWQREVRENSPGR